MICVLMGRLSFLLLLLLQTLPVLYANTNIRARAWQNTNNKFHFPEFEVFDMPSHDLTALSFSGGGSRSYIASMGYLAALHDLDLMDYVHYVGGISGGSWATAVYTYAQTNVSDSVLLGPIIAPNMISTANLQEMDANCARRVTNADMPDIMLTHYLNSNDSLFESWEYGVQTVYLDPFGIPDGIPFSQDINTVRKIKERNHPLLKDVEFMLPRSSARMGPTVKDRPIPLIAATLVGPLHMGAIEEENRNYTLFEMTSLSAGVAYSLNITYTRLSDQIKQKREVTVGGLLEPFASHTIIPPPFSLSKDTSTDIIKIPMTSNDPSLWNYGLDMKLVVASSSWATGCLISSLYDPEKRMSWSGSIPYWPSAYSPSPPIESLQEAVVADGGGLQVDNLISFVQRGVTSIVMFVSTNVPLQPSSLWDPAEDELLQSYIDFDIPSFFGVIPVDLSDFELRTYELKHSHIFAEDEWVCLAKEFQKAQADGEGIVVKKEHTTVRNDYFGISGDTKVNVTWVYLGRVWKWEEQLSPAMQELVVPLRDADNLAHTRESGPFEGFPNYPSLPAGLNTQRANLLADLTGWVILNNGELFRESLISQL